MFIYKITNRKNGKCYIGLDTKPQYKCARWNLHKKNYMNGGSKFYNALKKDFDAFEYKVIDEAADIIELAFKEIKWIAHYDSYKSGYNSSEGGDGIGCHDLTDVSEEQLAFIKEALSKRLSEYNTNKKWADTTEEERKEMTAHLNEQEIVRKRTKTLREFYKNNPEVKKEKGKAIVEWQQANREQLCKQNKRNSIKGAAAVSKKIKVISPDGEEKVYNSKSAFAREHGHIINRVIAKTHQGLNHNGWQGWEIND